MAEANAVTPPLQTAAATLEKAKLRKVLSRIDLALFTACAILGFDTVAASAEAGAQAITWLSDMPNIRNFDITFGKSTTPGLLRDIAFQSVERVSGQKPCFVARSTISQLK